MSLKSRVFGWVLEAVHLHYQVALPRLLSSAGCSFSILHYVMTRRISFCLSAQLYECQTSLVIKVHPRKWHGIAGSSESAANKPLPSQKMDPAFEIKYCTVFNISNNMVQQFSGNLMTRSGDFLCICCHPAAQTAVGV